MPIGDVNPANKPPQHLADQAKPSAEMPAEEDTGADRPDTPTAPKRSHLISRVLSPAVSWWLRSQLEHVEDLQFAIDASDRQLLAGNINQVSASASRAVYQGLHLSQVQVMGRDIQTNLRQLLRGKPLRLLAKFPVRGEIVLTEADLNTSLTAPLLANAITDFLLSFLQPETPLAQTAIANGPHLKQGQASLVADQIHLSGQWVHEQNTTPISISAGLSVKQGNVLKLNNIKFLRYEADQAVPVNIPSTLVFPLGSDVRLEYFAIQAGRLVCQGEIMVTPADPPA